MGWPYLENGLQNNERRVLYQIWKAKDQKADQTKDGKMLM